MDDKQKAAMFDALLEGMGAMSQKASGVVGLQSFAHGPGGILAQVGQRPQVVNAMVMPFGLSSVLPAQRSVYANEVFPILTGQTASSGENQTAPCADCKTPGRLKVCNQTWPFGRLCMDSNPIQVDRLGLLSNRGEFVDQTLVGNPFAQTSPAGPGGQLNAATALRNDKAKNLLELFVGWEREYSGLLYTGNPANNDSDANGNLAYGEPYGLDYIINNGYRDAYTGVLCPAADPLIISFGNANVETDINATVRTIVEAYAAQKLLAERTGLAPVRFALIMRYGLFRKLTEIWPCSYYTSLCSIAGTNKQGVIDMVAQRDLTDRMRRERFLVIEGDEVEVIVDATVTETIPVSGTAQSDVYLVPMSSPLFTHNTGGAITYRQFFDMNDPVRIANEGVMPGYNEFSTLGGGRFLVYRKAPTNVCIQYGMISRDRLIVEAPFLAARITGLRYTFQRHEREWNPAAPYYFYDGGNYQFSQPYFYPPAG